MWQSAVLRETRGLAARGTGRGALRAVPPPRERAHGPWQRTRAAGPHLTPLVPAAATLAVMLWRIQEPSFWRDETATLSAAHRSLPQLARMLGHVDAVHGAYYLLMWVVVRLGGSGELAVRFPSALAMAAAAGMVAVLGRRLVSARAGLAAGLVFAVLPSVSWFGQDARPFAVETAAACAASYLFVRAREAPPGPPRRRWLRRYSLSVAVLGLVNLFGLLLVAAHGLTLALTQDRDRDRERVRGPRRAPWPEGGRMAWGWAGAVSAAGAALAPFALLGWTQRSQINWLGPPGLGSLLSVGRLAGSAALGLALLAILLSSIAVAALAGRLRAEWPARLPALCLPWLLVPAGILLAVSPLRPVFTFRYIVFCIPALALLAGAAVASLGRVTGAGALALIVVLGLPAQVGERGPAGHGDAIRTLDYIVAAHERTGDGVLYEDGPGMRTFAAAYPFGLARLRDIALARSPDASGTLSGTGVALPVLRARLGHISRVWVIGTARAPRPVAELRGTAFSLVRIWHVSDIWLRLYERLPPAPHVPPRRAALPAPAAPAVLPPG